MRFPSPVFQTVERRSFCAKLRIGVPEARRLAIVLLPIAVLLGVESRAQGYQSPREQTALDITVTAAADVNPNEMGRGAPVLVRLYELRSPSSFQAADYLSLQSGDRATLGADLLVREEFVLRPGEQKRIRRKSHPDLEAIAVLAGFRDLAQSDWRAVEHVAPGPEAAWYRMPIPARRLKLAVQLQRQGIRVTHVE